MLTFRVAAWWSTCACAVKWCWASPPNRAQKELAVCARVKQDHHHLFSLHRITPHRTAFWGPKPTQRIE